VTEELRILWALSGLDDRLVALNGALTRYPAERQTLDARAEAERARLDTHKRRMGELQLERRRLEKDIESLVTEERKFQSQLPLVKKNEEYAALLHEISGAKSKRSDRETELLVLMDEEESLDRERPKIEKELAQMKSEMDARLATLEAAERSEREQAAEIERERQSLLGGLSPATRSRYERIRASREGRAVVPILKGACGGCYRGQPPQTLQEARRGDRLLACDGCGRLLVWPPEGA
jgi:predicted  nucleic acid-binding Zn-ribbon protein